MKVLKFGGTSLGTPQSLRGVIDIILSAVQSNDRIAVVVSALSGVTDQLIAMGRTAASEGAYEDALSQLEARHVQMAKAINGSEHTEEILNEIHSLCAELGQVLKGVSLVEELSPKTLDLIMGFGERLSGFMVSELIKPRHPETSFLDARSVIRTDDSFGQAVVDLKQTKSNIAEHFAGQSGLQIITGFIAQGPHKVATTLGRGGSDYTAALFAAALGVDEVQIWTDVDGVLTADPRKVRNAFTIPYMTYEEAMELSHFGAKVIYPPTMQPALAAGIPISIRNTFNPEGPFSIISDEHREEPNTITGISSISDIAVLRVEGSGMVGISGFASRLFGALALRNINVILISQASSEHSICFAVKPDAVDDAVESIEEEFALELQAHYLEEIAVERDCSVIAVVGEHMRRVPGISGRLFGALGKNGINVTTIAQGSSELNISVVIDKCDEAKALAGLHDSFFLSDLTSVNLFLIGPGSVGSTLLEQLAQHKEALRSEHSYDVRLVGLANSRKMAFDEDGIDLSNWQPALDSSEQQMDLSSFVEQIKELNLPQSIFVDCTANDTVASCYEELLSSAVSIATPNKRANSGSLERYQALQDTARRANVKYFYETTVGAGLPVISTLDDLLNSGDSIIRIEAVLSGTLSFIFNSFTEGRSFSSVVAEAKEKGYTEPDPRDDLSGTDVMRKLLILAREIGLKLEENDIGVESLVPPGCASAQSVDEFFSKLQQYDSEFADRQQSALNEGKVLRYIASISEGQASVSLQAVGADHPFYSLSGSDNIISVTTSRYLDRPLVVKGPGAGTAVTAAGIFADIFKAATYLR